MCGKYQWSTVKNQDRRHWTQLCGMFLMPLGPVFCPFPQQWTQAWEMMDAWAFCFILIYVCSCDVFERYIFRRLKGETSKLMQKEKKWTFKNRAGSQIITLTSNFGIKCFGHTIPSLWFWLFSTKHPVIKGRLVVGLFFFFFHLSSDKTVHHLPAQIWERERKREQERERWLAFFFFCLLFSF